MIRALNSFLKDESSYERIHQVFDRALKSLPSESQSTIKTQYRDFLLERGNSVAALNRNPLTVSTEFSVDSASSTANNVGLKRPATEDGAYAFTKQARFDGAAQPRQPAYGAYPQQQPYGSGEYYSQQPQQPQQQKQQQQPWQS